MSHAKERHRHGRCPCPAVRQVSAAPSRRSGGEREGARWPVGEGACLASVAASFRLEVATPQVLA
eukprot:7904587-Heterocapsa_arctica.AAC.1